MSIAGSSPETDPVRLFLDSRPPKSLAAVHYNAPTRTPLTRYYYNRKVVARFATSDPSAHYDRVIAALLKLAPGHVHANLLWMAVARFHTHTHTHPDAGLPAGLKPPPLPVPKRPEPGLKYLP